MTYPRAAGTKSSLSPSDSSGVYICKSIVNDLRHGNYSQKGFTYHLHACLQRRSRSRELPEGGSEGQRVRRSSGYIRRLADLDPSYPSPVECLCGTTAGYLEIAHRKAFHQGSTLWGTKYQNHHIRSFVGRST